MADVFLSYSHDDMAIMNQVRDELLSRGLDAWADDDLQPGTPSWIKAIELELENARCVVVIFTPSSKESHWVGEELNYASKRGLRIFPILAIGDEESSVPLGYTTCQWVDMRFETQEAMDRLIAALQNYLGNAPVNDEREHESEPAYSPFLTQQQLQERCFEFWKSFLEKTEGRLSFASDPGPSIESTITLELRQGLAFECSIHPRAAVAIRIDYGIGTNEKNKKIFDALYSKRKTFEADFGETLEWDRNNLGRSSMIFEWIDHPNDDLELQETMIETIIKFDTVIGSRIARLKV